MASAPGLAVFREADSAAAEEVAVTGAAGMAVGMVAKSSHKAQRFGLAVSQMLKRAAEFITRHGPAQVPPSGTYFDPDSCAFAVAIHARASARSG